MEKRKEAFCTMLFVQVVHQIENLVSLGIVQVQVEVLAGPETAMKGRWPLPIIGLCLLERDLQSHRSFSLGEFDLHALVIVILQNVTNFLGGGNLRLRARQ